MPTRDRTVFFYMTRSAPYEKSKFLGSGGSMVARLKLKEIDGRAPQGVKTCSHAAVTLRLPMKPVDNSSWTTTAASVIPRLWGSFRGDPQLTAVSSEIR
jgi:hypothetical protein